MKATYGPGPHSEHSFRTRLLLTAVGASLVLLMLPMIAPGSGTAWATCRHKRMAPKTGTVGHAARAVVCLINHHRVEHGLPRVHARYKLRKSAHRHSRYMARNGCFSHECSGEPSMMARIARTGYLRRATSYGCGEAIAWEMRRGGSPRGIVKVWMHSPEHRAILLTRSYKHVGIGVVWGKPGKMSSKAGTYTADFCYRHR